MKKRKRLHVPPLPGPAGQALADAASHRYVRAVLRRSGMTGKARALRGEGLTHEQAAWYVAVRFGKGPAAELSQACSFCVASGGRGQKEKCRLNPKANDPLVDLQVTCGRWVLRGVQVKVGRPQYVRAAIESGKYPSPIVANAEACDALFFGDLFSSADVMDRLLSHGTAAEQLTEKKSIALCEAGLRRILRNKKTLKRLDQIAIALASGRHDAVANFAAALADGLIYARGAEDVENALRDALSVGARAYARATLHHLFLIVWFDHHARSRYSSALIHRTAAMSLVAGEVAEAVVESVVDLVALARGEIDEATFWRRLAVTGMRAAGGTLVGNLVSHVTRDLPHPVQGVLTLAAEWAGREYFGALGERWFGDENE
jgi:hypothetical protein